MDKTPQQLYEDRKKRVLDAAALKKPDRVPVYMPMGIFGAKLTGITAQEAFANTDKWMDMNEKVFRTFEPDFYLFPNSWDMGSSTELDLRLYKWPGHGTPATSSYQFVEGEYMKAEEYDTFLSNPADFFIRTYLPRVCGNLKGFSNLAPLMSLFRTAELLDTFSDPEVIQAFEILIRAAKQNRKYITAIASFGSKMEELGYPNILGRGSQAPFDAISDFFRGLKGSTLDMFRNQEKLIAAQQVFLPYMIESTLNKLRKTGTPLCFSALHRGADGFMSLSQFEKFYWPGFKKVTLAFIDAGFIPFIFWEGTWDQRLEYLKELPKGKTVGWFDRTDLFKAKKVIGDTMCICGGMPISILSTGTAEQVENYAKRLIDEVGEGGGFIMGSSVELDHAQPELVKVWIDFTRKYGVYR